VVIMDPAMLFRICNLAVLPGWALLVIAPRWKWTRLLIAPVIVPLLLALVYLYLVGSFFGSAHGSFGTLEGVMQLFSNPHVALAGWIHYLVFDLFIGSWEVRDSQAREISHFIVVPCLVLTFLFGPVGLLLYFIVRFALRNVVAVGEGLAAN
jgi:Domain of unknown function (DUF4281)